MTNNSRGYTNYMGWVNTSQPSRVDEHPNISTGLVISGMWAPYRGPWPTATCVCNWCIWSALLERYVVETVYVTVYHWLSLYIHISYMLSIYPERIYTHIKCPDRVHDEFRIWLSRASRLVNQAMGSCGSSLVGTGMTIDVLIAPKPTRGEAWHLKGCWDSDWCEIRNHHERIINHK